MARDEESRHRHPDAVSYLEGLTREEADMHPPLIRRHGDGFIRYWLEGGEVRSRVVTEDELQLAGVLSAVSADLGPRLPDLAAKLAADVPDLDGVERALRDSSLGGGAVALKLLFERLDRALPGPECGGCGRPMRRSLRRKGRSFVTRLGRVGVERDYWRCRSCGEGCFPLDRALGLEGEPFTPGMASVMAGTAPLMGFGAASRHIANLAGVKASPSSLRRWSLALGEDALRFERDEVVEGGAPADRMYLAVDGTGIPMRGEETEGVRGKGGDGKSRTREAKLAVIYTAEGRDRETGAALKDRGSETFSCLIDSAAATPGSPEPSGFATRLGREARRRGLRDAGELVVISDGAEWIRNSCGALFGDRKVEFVLDAFHALEYASDAVKAIHPEGVERARRFAEVRADMEAGRAAKVVRELEPHRDRHREVEACCRYFRNNIERMRYGEYRDRGMQIGSGVVESGCRMFGLRMKRSGTRWSEKGANAMLGLKTCTMNHRLTAFLRWRTAQPVVA